MSNSIKRLYLSQRGLGLIELMISMLIGLFIMAGVLQMFSTTSQNAIVTAGASRIQENLRYAFSRIAEDISQSGNLGCMSSTISTRYAKGGGSKVTNLLGLNGAAVVPNSLYDFLTVVHGTSSAVDNLGGDAAADTDIFRIRYVANAFKIPVTAVTPPNQVTIDTADNDFPSLQANQVVAVSNCTNGAVFMLNAVPVAGAVTITGAAAPTGIYNASTDMGLSISEAKESQYFLYGGATGAYEYYISSAAGGDCSMAREECALWRRSSGTAEELVQGVHDMEVLYGSTSLAGNLTFSNAAGVADWSLVDRLKLTMMFNSIDDAQTQGNNISGSFDKTVSRTFNLYNQL